MAAEVLRMAGLRATAGLRVAVGFAAVVLVAEVFAEVVMITSCHCKAPTVVIVLFLRSELFIHWVNENAPRAGKERFRDELFAQMKRGHD